MTDAAIRGSAPIDIDAHRPPCVAADAPLDIDALNRLRVSVGAQAFDEVFEDAVFEVTERLARLEALAARSDIDGVGRLSHDLIAVAAQIGLRGVSEVAARLRDCCATENVIAMHAVAARLLRVGEDSLVRAAEMSVDINDLVEGA
ncbi:MAG: Hpt domain-containing protein [Pseudomonadota bacterium]